MASIVVCIRLSELPIKYYDMEVLKQIGKSIEDVLRIDTHTASESRGRYARLCIQVDVEKPLTTSLIIEGIEHPISYEGIHKLCFSCGRISHWRDACPFLVCSTSPKKVKEDVVQRDQEGTTCKKHDLGPYMHELGEDTL